MQRRSPLPAVTVLALTALTALTAAACGQATSSHAGTSMPRQASQRPEPIATIEPACAADYFQFASAGDLVARADLVVRLTATDPSRNYDSYPLSPAGDGSFLPPGEGRSPQEWEALGVRGTPASAITVRVEEVLKGDASVGDVFEVNQNSCTARPLPIGEDRQYLMALESSQLHPASPRNQLNDSQATWQVADDRSLTR